MAAPSVAPTTTTIVVMGVSGSGKTTIAKELVGRLGWAFAEGDTFHPAANIDKMRAGIPLDDADRWPWLRALAAWIGEHEEAGRNVVVTCSALKRAYRDLLRDGHRSVWFAHVTVDADKLRRRVEQRQGHYMPSSLLDSQLATLQPLQPDEPGVAVAGDEPPAEVAAHILTLLREQRGIVTTPTLQGRLTQLRPATPADAPVLAGILAQPEVAKWWGTHDEAWVRDQVIGDPDTVAFTIESGGDVVGLITYYEENEPDYRHAAIDISVAPSHHRRGLGSDALRTLARHLITDRGHHRLSIDPAAHNEPAIRCYSALGFRPVGILRRYERGPDGTWHDGLLMDLLAEELV